MLKKLNLSCLIASKDGSYENNFGFTKMIHFKFVNR